MRYNSRGEPAGGRGKCGTFSEAGRQWGETLSECRREVRGPGRGRWGWLKTYTTRPGQRKPVRSSSRREPAGGRGECDTTTEAGKQRGERLRQWRRELRGPERVRPRGGKDRDSLFGIAPPRPGNRMRVRSSSQGEPTGAREECGTYTEAGKQRGRDAASALPPAAGCWPASWMFPPVCSLGPRGGKRVRSNSRGEPTGGRGKCGTPSEAGKQRAKGTASGAAS